MDSGTAVNISHSATHQRYNSATGGSLLLSSLVSPSLSSVNNNTHDDYPKSDPTSVEIDNFLSQLKYKRTFQDDDTDVCKGTSILSSSEVSKLLASFNGAEKLELKADVREILKLLKEFFKEYLKATKVNNGSKAVELLQEVAYTPEHVVFQETVSNEPTEWIQMGLSVVQDKERKEVVAEKIKRDIQDVQLNRKKLAMSISIGRKELENLKAERKKKEGRMSSDNVRRHVIALESYQRERDLLEAKVSKRSSIKETDLADILVRFEELKKTRNATGKQELEKLSHHNSLPPNIKDANLALKDRKLYLESLMKQIESPSSPHLTHH